MAECAECEALIEDRIARYPGTVRVGAMAGWAYPIKYAPGWAVVLTDSALALIHGEQHG